MIGGSEPPLAPKKVRPRKAATSATPTYSGHGGAGAGKTPHERVMAIIEKEEEREAKKRAEEVAVAEKAGKLAV